MIEWLRKVTLLAGLTTEEYLWLANHGTEHFIRGPSLIFREGQPLMHMTFILEGEFQIRRRARPPALFFRRAGQTAGLLPFSRMKAYGGDGITTCPVRVLNIHRELFPEMLVAIPSMGERCLGALLDRVRQDTRVEQKAEKFESLVRVSDDLAQPASTDFLVAGDLVGGRFRIVRSLGGGGMGRVYQAHDTELGVPVALKIIRPEFSTDTEMLARFRREVLIARRITHPNVCRTFDLDHETRQLGEGPLESGEIVFLTMEYLDGETLRELLSRTGKLEPGEALLFASQMAAALTAAHQGGIVHRDIKPTNVMIVPSSSISAPTARVVITDFGLASFAEASQGDDVTSITVPGRILGTLSYMAPEQLMGDTASPATDILCLWSSLV
jgi:CRP-like cAMP-binding protein